MAGAGQRRGPGLVAPLVREFVAPTALVLAGLAAALAVLVVVIQAWSRRADRGRPGTRSGAGGTPEAGERARAGAGVAAGRARSGYPGATILVAALLAISGCGWAFAELTRAVVERNGLAAYDRAVAVWLAGHRQPWLTTTMRVITVLGTSWIMIAAVVVAAALPAPRSRRIRNAVVAFTVVTGTGLLVEVIKTLMGRGRPAVGGALTPAFGYAFPSGHAAQVLATFGVVAYLLAGTLTRTAARVAVWATAGAVVLLVGFSRLYLGAHWLTDVLAGYALAAAWTITVLTVSARWRR